MYLERDPDNEHDANAVGVWLFDDEGNDALLGYVGKELAADLAPLLDAGHQSYINSHEIKYNDDLLGLKIEIRVAESKTEKLPTGDRLKSEIKVQAIAWGISIALAGLVGWWLYSLFF